MQDCFDFIYFNYAEELPGEVRESSCAQVERALADDEIHSAVGTNEMDTDLCSGPIIACSYLKDRCWI